MVESMLLTQISELVEAAVIDRTKQECHAEAGPRGGNMTQRSEKFAVSHS